jgi:hypothetical protein
VKNSFGLSVTARRTRNQISGGISDIARDIPIENWIIGCLNFRATRRGGVIALTQRWSPVAQSVYGNVVCGRVGGTRVANASDHELNISYG